MSDEDKKNGIKFEGSQESFETIHRSVDEWENAKKAFEEFDYTGKTTEQILSHLGVTQEEVDAAFPPGYVPLDKPIKDMTKEERIKCISETSARLKLIQRASTKDAVPQPTYNALAEKYTKEQDDVLDLNPGLKEILEYVAGYRYRVNVSENEKLTSAMQVASEIFSFDAKKANQLWQDKIKSDSNLTGILGLIYKKASSGNSEVLLEYVSTYDKLKLTELGFGLTRKEGRAAQYQVSWGAQ